jgi:hypothetical protein
MKHLQELNTLFRRPLYVLLHDLQSLIVDRSMNFSLGKRRIAMLLKKIKRQFILVFYIPANALRTAQRIL